MAEVKPICDSCGHTKDLHMVGVNNAGLCVGIKDEWNDPEPCPCDGWVGYRQVGWLTKGGAFMPMFDRYGRPIETPEGWEPYQPMFVKVED